MIFIRNNSDYIFKYICIIILIIYFLRIKKLKNKTNDNKHELKIALCTMGKMENLYAKEFIDYYFKLGISHIFIYDHNAPNTEKIINIVENIYRNKVSIFETSKMNITNQAGSFTDCYQKNKYLYDWFLMIDMDEYLYIVNDSLKNYLSDSKFDKCDIINFHWVQATDNNLLFYDNRSLFERFKGPYKKSEFVKSIVRGNITKLKYSVHSPSFSPERNITCNNEGKKINYTILEIEDVSQISTKYAYIIHFRYKSTEEFIKKFKRGYSNWFGNRIKAFLYGNLREYFQLNKITLEKINYIENELNISLKEFRDIYNQKQNKTLFHDKNNTLIL